MTDQPITWDEVVTVAAYFEHHDVFIVPSEPRINYGGIFGHTLYGRRIRTVA